MTTHDPSLATAVARDAVLLNGGQVVAQGPVEPLIRTETLSATTDIPVEVIRMGARLVILPD